MVVEIVPPLENNTGFITTDPTDCTNYGRPDAQLQEFLIFCVCVAGKNARTIQRALQRFWSEVVPEVRGGNALPFQIINRWVSLFDSVTAGPSALSQKLKECGIGCHKLKARSMLALAKAKIDLRTCTPEELEKFPGIGPKTSRFFILHSRRDAKVACLDVHILRYMREKRKIPGVPNQTPQSRKKYLELETTFLGLVPRGKTPAEFDLHLWLEATKNQ